MQVGIDLKDVSTYAGAGLTLSGLSEMIMNFVPEPHAQLVHLVVGAVGALAGLAFVLTKNYKNTPSKIDDFIHGVSGTLSNQKD